MTDAETAQKHIDEAFQYPCGPNAGLDAVLAAIQAERERCATFVEDYNKPLRDLADGIRQEPSCE